MEYLPVAQLIRELDRQVKRILAMADVQSASQEERKVVEGLKLHLNFAGRYGNDFELADNRDEQRTAAKKAAEYLEKAEQAILQASNFGFFDATDVADTTSQSDRIIAYLRKV